ncbi:MAG: 4a-hydroxytetrahydrobiopterin dehydratase [Cyanobacteria bacterium REEB459]|nr:4a-hydroxytetrahydrobiopterin dehydratase [Cyanobacteria bacterium REEB459]
MATLLSPAAVDAYLAQLPDWHLEGKTIVCTRSFKTFVAAIDFVNRLVQPAETAGHHPDLAISYNRVVIHLTTHDQGGLTAKDFDLARVIDTLA